MNTKEIQEQIATIRRGEVDAFLGVDEYADTMEAMLKENKRLKDIASDCDAETPGTPEPQIDDSRTGLLVQRERLQARNELLEKVAKDADDVMNYPDIREFLGSEMCQTFNKNRAALAASKEQT